MNTAQLCEAISINFGDKCRDVEAIPDETEILRNCSSLVRLSVDGRRFEFAHFTVEEFLKNLDGTKDGEFVAYHISLNRIGNELSKVCLTYLNFVDFDQGGNASLETTTNRFKQYPFRKYVVKNWSQHARSSDWNDTRLFALATELFHPSKPSTLISWAKDIVPYWSRPGIYQNEDDLATINCGIAEATALHYAAMFSLSEVCKWLIENGRDVNRRSAFGTPLHCAQLSFTAFYDCIHEHMAFPTHDRAAKELETIDLLLSAGADPKINSHSAMLSSDISRLCSPHPNALSRTDPPSIVVCVTSYPFMVAMR